MENLRTAKAASTRLRLAPLAALVMELSVLATGCAPSWTAAEGTTPVSLPAAGAPASFVGRQACGECHPRELELWQGSHHDLAMQAASEATVLGDFSGASLEHFGVASSFFRRDGDFVVRTDGPDGRLADFPVAYTFGAEPLQQYLAPMPGGRYQALALAWDARAAAEGGQRWYHLYPWEAVAAGDPLHWTGAQQSWNSMCAECHSTGLEKRYLPAEDRYETRFAELDVSCEACHGPGSAHVGWARSPERDLEGSKGLAVQLARGAATWEVDPATGSARGAATTPARSGQLDACGRCHARRTPIAATYDYGRPLLDSHRLSLLDAGLYHADGQIDGEVFEVGSFMQSKMHRRGVACTDCHEPHAAKLRAEGNAICAGGHAPARFDVPAHHHHAAGSAGAQCVSCHMPEKTYLGVDGRRDHSLRVPRPDLTAEIGTPNACNGCHARKTPVWAAAAIASWTGREPQPHWGEAIDAGRRGLSEAPAKLAAVVDDPEVPAIARATALALLPRQAGSELGPRVAAAATDLDSLLRLAAAGASAALEPTERLRLASPLLHDPVLGVRIEAAAALAPVIAGLDAAGLLGAADRARLERGLAELRGSHLANAERPEAQLNLGWLEAQLGDLEAAEAAFRRALALDPGFTAARLNLADLHRRAGRDDRAEPLLREAATRSPRDAAARHALGLLLIRRGRLAEAVAELRKAAELAPGERRYGDALELAVAAELGAAKPRAPRLAAADKGP